MPDEIRELSSTNICKRCNSSVTNGHKCRKCGTLSHKSCLKAIKATFYEDSTVDCCLNAPVSAKKSNIAKNESTVNNVDLDKSIEQIRIAYLEEIIRQKDLVINNQAMLVESLQAQLTLLSSNISARTESNSKVPSKPKSSSYSEMTSNGNNKSANKMDFSEQQKTSKKIMSSDVSCAIHTAKASKLCHDVINLANDVEEKPINSMKSQKNRRRNLLVGSADSDNGSSSFKSAKIIQMKHFHITNCDPNTTQEVLKLHLNKIVPMVQVESLKSRNPEQYSSFKISIPILEAPKILKAELWPSGVVINQFFRPRSQQGSNTKDS